MAYTFKGTAVTGEGEGNFITFGAREGDTYLNKQTGHVYKCIEVHRDWQAKGWCKWRYVKTDIIAKPDKGVFNVSAPTIGNGDRVFTTNWVVFDSQKSDKNGKRITTIRRVWQVNSKINFNMSKNYPLLIANDVGKDVTQTQLNLNSFKANTGDFERKDFYPFKDSKGNYRTITSLSCTVYTKNNIGLGPAKSASRNLEAPREPVISDPTFNAETGHLTFTITTDAGNDLHERYDTYYEIEVYDTYDQSRSGKQVQKGTDQSTSFTVSYDAEDYMQMGHGDYIRVTLRTYARGLYGDSKTVSSTYYISYPSRPSILGADISSEDSTGKCTVSIDTNNKQTAHPVDGVKLEYLTNVEYATAEAIPGDVDWKDTGIVDDGDCTALSVAVTELIPDRGKYTWLRVKSWHAAEGRLFRYSAYKPILYKPAATAEDEEIKVLSAVPAQGGKSISVHLGWNANGTDDATGTELSWSNELDTWKSTKDPERYQFTWSDGEIYLLTDDATVISGKTYYTKSGNTYTEVSEPSSASLSTYYERWRDSATIVIKGLTEGEKYYVKARRYLEGDTTTYSEYSQVKECVTNQIPDSIVLLCDDFVPKGSPLPVYWTFSGNGIQTEWQMQSITNAIRAYPRNGATALSASWLSLTNGGSALTPSTGNVYILMQGSGAYLVNTIYKWNGTAYVASEAKTIAKGTGSTGFAQIDAQTLARHSVDDVLTIRAGASTGSDFVWSDWKTVSIVSAPTLEVTANNTLTAQPFSFDAEVSTPCRLLIIISSDGASSQFPTGARIQTAGDTIYSDVVSPSWGEYQLTEDVAIDSSKTYYELGEDGFYSIVAEPDVADIATYYEFAYTGEATVTASAGLDFWNLGNYKLSVTAIDDATGLQSATVEKSFSVNWTNTAFNPAGGYKLTTDTAIETGKLYYTRSGSGTEESPYVYTVVDEPSVSSLSSYYEYVSYVTLTPIDETADDGKHRKAVQIDLSAPSTAGENDVYDIYRLSGDGAQLIGEGLPLEYSVVDEYAPYGEGITLYYRVVVRTEDGDINFADFEYVADGDYLRFDWDGYYLESPYSVSVVDSYSKDVDIRQHMDGSSAGYWNNNIQKKGSLSTDVIKIIQPTEADLARQLARYAGTVFVRTPNGEAYEADVQVTDLSLKNKAVYSIAFDATEVGLTKAFMLPIPETEEEEE